MRNFTLKKFRIVILLGLLMSCLTATAQTIVPDPVPFSPRLAGGSVRVKGDVMFVGNHILNRSPNPNTANTGGGENNGQTMEYIDIDGDSNTFSSSSADLAWPVTSSCYRVVYAGLYWASIYPFERSTDQNALFTPGNGTGDNVRHPDWNQVKFKIPGGAYNDLTADDEIFDGFGYYPGAGTALSRSFKDCPIICYKDITSLVQNAPTVTGTYTVANIRAAKGRRQGGSSAGWVMVVIYENLDAATTSKFISIFDGYSGVGGNSSAPINITGFTTLPAPFAVNARLGIAALEGDRGNTGDGLGIKANSTPGTTFTPLSTPNNNPANDFFNSTITNNDVMNLARNPASTNTLGFDLDMFTIPNPTVGNVKNSVIPNSETGAQLKLTTNGDGYGAFLATFAVDVIEPRIVLTKTVKNLANQDIAGQDVELGNELFYEITYKNVGNDDAQNFTIRDILPVNTSLVNIEQVPAGVNVTYPVPGTILFTITNNSQIVKNGTAGTHTIRFRVKVASTCNELTDHCANIIQNTAYGTYRGIENTSIITDDPSVSSIACNAVPGPVNFLVNVANCEYKRTEILCGPTLTLTAGDGYPSYAWYREAGATDVFLGSTQSITVSAPGDYYVINTPTPPCVGLTELITVNLSSNLPPNPLVAQADETAVCANNGIVMTNIFLCGINAQKILSAGTIAGTASWYRLDSAACNTAIPANCPHNGCPEASWNLQSTGTNYTANASGEYRLVINNNGCQAVYYFNVYKNDLDPQVEIKDMLCGANGEIKVINVGAGYEYQFRNQGNGAILQAYSANNVYTVTTLGVYRVEIRQVGVTNGCEFTIPNIGIVDADLDVTVTSTDKTCDTLAPSGITLEPFGLLFVSPQQQYKYDLTGPATLTSGWINNHNPYSFNNLIAGTYTITVTTDGGCTFTDTVTIYDYSNPQVTAAVQQSITCDPGVIQITATGGEAPYSFAAYTKDGVNLNPVAADYFSDGLYSVPATAAGTYVFVVVDANGCIKYSNPVTITTIVPTVTQAFVNPKCVGDANGTITVTATGTGITYELVNSGGTVVLTNATGNFINLAAGTYTVNVIQTGVTTVCRYPYTFTLVPATAITATAALTQPLTCVVNATITAGNASGGTGPYEYSINGTTFGTAQVFPNLTAGTYRVTVRDANGCTFQTTPIIIAAPPAITAINVVQTAVTCPAQTSNVTLTATGGTGSFTYAITAPASAIASNTTGVFNSLAPNTYSVLVTDSYGCTRTGSFTINPITPITVTGTMMKPVACIGTATGAIRFTLTGYGANYNYTITPSAGGTIITPATVTGYPTSPLFFNNLAAGTYTIVVTDPVTNCTATTAVTVTAPTAALTVTPNVTQPTCTTLTGSVTVATTGGWGSNSYVLAGPTPRPAQASPSFTGLTPGNYTVTVTDANGCIVTSNFTITPSVAPDLSLVTASSDLCYDTTNGASITVAVAAGTGTSPFQYQLNTGAFQASAVFNNLAPGTHTITVRDGNNCTDTVTQVINPQLTASASLSKGITCTIPAAAQIAVTIGGGQASYGYEVTTDGGTTYSAPVTVTGSFTYSTATAGNYQFRITDATGCIVTTGTTTVVPITPPQFTLTPSQVLCNGASTGSIAVNINTAFGTAPYTVAVTNTTTATAYNTQTTGLPAGNYSVTVTDRNGCTTTNTTTITEVAPIAYSYIKTDISCNNPGGISYGQIEVASGGGVTGGTPPYTYTVSNNFGDVLPVITNNPGTSSVFLVVNYGIYKIEVTDANGCTQETNDIIIASPPDDLEITINAAADCINGGTVTVEVDATVGSGTYKFAILTQSSLPFVANPATDYKDPDVGTPEIATFTNLIPGFTYTFVVWDTTTQCYFFKQASAPIPTNSTIAATAIIPNNVTCFGAADGNVSFTFNGYSPTTTQVKYEIFKSPSNLTTGITDTILTTGTSTTVNSIPGNLIPGDYIVVFTEIDGTVAGCSKATTSFKISQSPQLLAVSAVVTKNDNCDLNAGVITATAQYGTAPYEYQLVLDSDPAPTEATWAGSALGALNAEGGDYIVYAKDANDCIRSFPITLPTDVSPVITAALNAQCNTAEGTFVIDVARTAGSVGPYTYSLNGSAFEAKADTFQYTDLNSGSYEVRIQDGNGCIYTIPANVTVNPPMSISVDVTIQPACADLDGEITAQAAGGNGIAANYRYELTGAVARPQQVSNVFAGLPHGTYTVIVHDVTGAAPYCTAQVTVTLEDAIEILPADITFTKQDVTCAGDANGSITVALAATNTDIPYTYSLNGGLPQADPLFTGLAGGTYTIDVTSDKGCTAQITVIIDEPLPLAINVPAITVTPFACNPTDNTPSLAVITFDAVAGTGTAPYKYSIDGIAFFDAPDNTFEVVDTGSTQTITLYVMDDHGCEVTETITLDPLPVMTAADVTQVTAITCTNDEEVTVTVTGGSGEYSFELLPTGSQAIQTPGAGVYSANFTLTAVDSYTFKVTDIVTGCTITTAPYVINEYDLIEVTATASTPISCFTSTDGTITIDVQDYTGPYNYTVFNGAVSVATGPGNTTTNPFTITGLSSGNLFVTVEATGTPFCTTDTNTITVDSPADALTAIAVQTGSVQCTNDQGEITVSATGGWGGYEYQLVNTTTATPIQPFGTNNLFTGLPAGTYELTVRDSGGCANAVDTVILAPIAPITASIAASAPAVLCNGDQTVTIQATAVSGGQGSYEYILNTYDAAGTAIVSSTGAQLSPVFANIGAGIYSITVTDGWNCGPVETVTVTVTEPDALMASLSLTKELTCFTDAEITIAATGGTPPYTYSTDNITYTATTVYTVGAGTYTYYVKDDNGCVEVMTNEVNITPVPALELNLNLAAAEISCAGGSNAVILAAAAGGLGNYQFSLLDAANAVIDGPKASGEFENLGIGTYYVRVDSGDCNLTSAVITITEPNPLVVTYDVDHILCWDGPNSTNGRITVNAAGGTGDIKYAISPNLSQFFDSNVFYPLAEGTYEVLVQDENGCYDSEIIIITKPTEIQAQLVNVTDEACLGAADGTIEVTLSGGTGTYEISIDDITYVPVTGTTYLLTGLPSGLTTVYVKDQNGCSLNPPMEQPILPGVDMAPEATVATTCVANSPNNDVTITIIPGVDPANVTYSIDGINYQPSNVFTDVSLAPGTYIGYARHIVPVTNLTCIQTDDFVIDAHTAIAATATVSQTIDCFGDTGEITINVTPGSGSGTLEYAVGPAFVFGASNVFALTTGTYDFKVRDEIGCEFDITGVLIGQPLAPLTAVEAHTNEICLNAADGTITVTPADGTAPYEVTIDGGTTYTTPSPAPVTFSNLIPGDYTVEVRDANGCLYTLPADITILPGVDLQASIDDTQVCEVSTIVVSVNPAVAADVTYYLDGVAQPSSPITASNLTVGSHTVDVTHDNGCSQQFTFTVAPVIPFDVAGSTTGSTDALCFGESTGTATLNITGGTAPLTFAISPDVTPRTFGTYQASNTFTGLASGDYVINVKDALGCESESVVISIGQPAGALTVTATHTDEICLNAADGTITVMPGALAGTAPYEYRLNGGAYSAPVAADFTFSDLVPDDYTVEVRDANGCLYTLPADITILPGVDLQASIDDTQVCEVSTIVVSVNPAVAADVTYYLDGVAQPSSTITASNLTPGSHTVDVTHDNGCSQQFTFTVAPVIPFDVAGSTTGSTDALCFGEATGTATLNITGGTAPLTFAISPDVTPRTFGTYQASNTFTGLASGDYVINVKDALGCESESVVISIGQPAGALTVTATHTDEICLNAADGTITVTPGALAGTAPYEYRLNGGAYSAPVAADFTFTNLVPDDYTVEVRDANGCLYTLPADVTILPGVDLQASIDDTQVCEVSTIVVSVNPAVAADVTYYLDGVAQPSSPITASNLTVGSHTVDVTHDNGCSQQFTFTVAPVIPFDIAGSTTGSTDALCFGESTGTATLNITGGTAPLTYAISPDVTPRTFGTYQASNTFTGLASGDYVINVKDALGCESESVVISIGQPAAALTATATHTDEICINQGNGTITVTPGALAGTAPYEYRLNGGAYSAPVAADFTFTNLVPDDYTVEVRDANGCLYTLPASVTVAPGFDLQASSTFTQECDQITVNFTVNPSVVNNVTYYVDNVAYTTSPVVITDAAGATHTVRVEHTNGCIANLPDFTTSPVVPIILTTANVVVTPIACHGKDVGTIVVNPTGGTAPLQYAITWGISPTPVYGPSNTFTDLLANENEGYTLWVKDAIGCVETVTVLLDEPDEELIVTAAVGQHESCINAQDGAIDITLVQGGTPPYSIALDSPTNWQPYNAGATPDFGGLYGRTLPYDIYIMDARGCYAKATVTIERGVNLVPGITTVLSCDNNVPVTTVTATLNTIVNNVVYRLETATGTLIQDFAPNKTWTLQPGDYMYTVQHINGCEKEFTFTVAPRPDVQITLATREDAKCNGAADGSITVTATGGTGLLRYGISPDYVMTGNTVFAGLPAGSYSVRVEDQYGCFDELGPIVINEPNAIAMASTLYPEVCVDDDNGAIEAVFTEGTAPYYSSINPNGPFEEGDTALFENLDGGVAYTIYVRDANGCTAEFAVQLPDAMDINATAQVVYDCSDNSVTIATNGTISPAQFTYTIVSPQGNNTPQVTNEFTNLEDGTYTVEVVHSSGCSDTVEFTITSVPDLALSLAMSGFNQFSATVAGGAGPYTYTFQGSDVGSTNTFVYYSSGVYEVTVTDSRGCTRTATIEVTFIEVELPDVVTPNDDGQNDTWSPGNTQNYPNINTQIFDRYGRKLATLKRGDEWNATYDGNEMPTGDYWYLIELGDPEGRSFTGHFTIYR